MNIFQFWHRLSPVKAIGIFTVALALINAPAAAQNYFYNVTDLVVGNEPAGVILADFNHDGIPDLAVTNAGDSTVSVILGSSDGQFATRVNYATGANPGALVAADFRGDGNTDLAIVNEVYDGSGSVSVLLGNADGSFQTQVAYPVGDYPVGIVAADFNGDGKVDLALVNEQDNTVSILLGNGDGTFQPQTLVAVGTEPTSLAFGDFNNDHKTDLVASCVGSGVVSVLLSNGDGTFTRVDSSSGILSPDTSLVVVGDFNKDKKLDVVVSSKIFEQLFLLLGEENGSFGAPTAIPGAAFDPVNGLIAADLNRDGKLDLASAGGDEDSGLVVVLGEGDGTFKQPIVSPTGPLTALAVADLNGDGHLDVAGVSDSVNAVGLFLGKGDGTFAMPTTATMASTVYGAVATVAADFNGDGRLDLAVAETNFPNGQISVVLGKGEGKFGKPRTSPVSGESVNNDDLLFPGDFNGDGKVDLLIMDDYERGFGVLMGNGNGTFQKETDTLSANTLLSVAVGDFNDDGKTDVVTTTNGGGGSPSMNIYVSNGDGTFTSGVQFAVPFYSAVYVADVNRDGKLDLVVTSFAEPLEVFLGKGDGTFQKPISGPTASYSSKLVFGDFNGDGKPDIAVGTYDGMAFLAGNGKGNFQSPVYSNSTVQFCCELAVGDINGDGRPDLITNLYSTVAVMVSNGDGTFRYPVTYSENGQLYSGNMVVDDFNSDGVSDIGLIFQDLYSGAIVASLYLSEPTVHLFPATVSFGSVAVGQTSPATNIQVTNLGNSALSISGVAVSGDFVEQNNCGTELAIGESCTVQASFKPTAKGVFSGKVTIKDNATPSPQQISLKGTGQ